MHFLRNAAIVAGMVSAVIAGSVSAATVDIGYTSFKKNHTTQAIAQRDAFIGSGRIRTEDFETGFTPCIGTNGTTCSAGTILSSEMGTFTGYGGASASGGSQVAPKDQIVVRTGAAGSFGRYNVTPGGVNWLDSNDREGIDWSFAVPGDRSIRRLAFLLTDLDDVGTIIFNISVNGDEAVARPVGEAGGNARLHLITMLFDAPVKSFDIRMVNGTGDGFGLDGARLAAVPVPAAGLLLLTTLGALSLLARRRRRAG